MAIEDNYKNITDSFETGFENNSNKELVHRYGIIGISPYTKEKIALEMNRRLISEIEEFNKSSSKQTEKMINLTQWIMWLTIFLGVLALIQILILFTPFFIK